MTLREELEERADKLDAELLGLSGRIKEIERQSNELHTCLNALDIAEMDAEDEAREWAEAESLPVTDEQPELFEAEKAEAREQLEREDDASEFAEPMPDPEFVVLDEQTCEPVEEAPALNEAMQDEREQPVTDVAALIASGEHSYDEVAAIAYPEPDGYAPVTDAWIETTPGTLAEYVPPTNPEADALAKAHEYYDPKAVADRERNAGMARLFSYNPFYKPKVDA